MTEVRRESASCCAEMTMVRAGWGGLRLVDEELLEDRDVEHGDDDRPGAALHLNHGEALNAQKTHGIGQGGGYCTEWVGQGGREP